MLDSIRLIVLSKRSHRDNKSGLRTLSKVKYGLKSQKNYSFINKV